MNGLAPTIILGISLILLIMISGIFSAAETAFTSITKFKYDTFYKKKKKNWLYNLNLKLLNNYTMTLSAILIGNTLINVLASTLSTLFFTNLLVLCNVSNPEALATGIATGVVTIVVLMFGEFTPKSLARKHGLGLLKILGPFVYFFYTIFWPLSWLLNKIIKQPKTKSATEQELDTLIDIVTHEGVISTHEASLVSNALKFDDIRIINSMTKRDDIITIDYNSTKEEIIQMFIKSKFTRIPVVNKGKFVGLLNLKSYFLSTDFSSTKDNKLNMKKIIDPIIWVSQYDTLNNVLQEMQVHQTHLSLVMKNNTSKVVVGIVTMEDLIEKLVGNIYDENDEFKNLTKINDFTWKVSLSHKARNFLKTKIKSRTVVDKNITFSDWAKSEFKIKKYIENKSYENDELKIIIRKDSKNNFYLIIEKKLISY